MVYMDNLNASLYEMTSLVFMDRSTGDDTLQAVDRRREAGHSGEFASGAQVCGATDPAVL